MAQKAQSKGKGSKKPPKGKGSPQEPPSKPQEAKQGDKQQEGNGKPQEAPKEGQQGEKAKKSDPIRELAGQKAQSWYAKGNRVFSLSGVEGTYEGVETSQEDSMECALYHFTQMDYKESQEGVKGKASWEGGGMKCLGVFEDWLYALSHAAKRAWKEEVSWFKEEAKKAKEEAKNKAKEEAKKK